MFILNNPYVSDFLVETIRKNNYKVLDNEIARNYFSPYELTNEKEKCYLKFILIISLWKLI